MKKKVLVVAAMMSLVMALPAFAAGWKQDAKGWWYENDNGSYKQNEWFTEADGKAYYFGMDGYMLTNTTTPDGYQVGADGAYINSAPLFSFSCEKFDAVYLEHWTQIDYDGNKALVLRYEFTNKENEPKYPDIQAGIEAYQNGRELEHSYISSDDLKYERNDLKKVMQGASLKTMKMFKLEDDSPITLIISDQWNWKKDAPKQTVTLNIK